MFESLSGKLQNVFRNLRGLGKISDSNVSDSLRDVRVALLDADVNFKVARDFIERVKEKALGQQVIQSIHPGQQIIKLISDELVTLLGSQNAGLNLSASPTCILMVGLHGSGKTTSSGKLASWLKKQGRQPLLVGCDVYRPAAMDQLDTLGKQLDVPVFLKRGETDVLKIARDALQLAKLTSRNVIIQVMGGLLGAWEGQAPRFDSIPTTLLYETIVDAGRGTLIRHAVVKGMEEQVVEHPHINPNMEGLPVRYIWMSIGSSSGLSSPPIGYMRLDRHTGDRQIWMAPIHTYCEEVIVVPKSNTEAEDDCWIVASLFDSVKELSSVAIFDGKDMAKGPVARIWLKHALPHSLHGCFVRE